MLVSLALITLSSLSLGAVCIRLKLPSLLGMILVGIVLGPQMLNLIDPHILGISAELRKIALVIILTRAGLTLDINDLKKVGRPALLMSFVPACFEILGYALLGGLLLNLDLKESLLLGSVIAAVSPAVVVPRMLLLMEMGYGDRNKVPQLIMAGASIDDIFVIVLFTMFLSMMSGSHFSALSLIQVPISIALGSAIGYLSGAGLVKFFKKLHMRDSVKVLIILSVSFLLLGLEELLSSSIQISGLIAIMSLGMTILTKYKLLAERLSLKYNKLWVAAEIFLFVLVGSALNPLYALKAGPIAVLIVLLCLLFRMLGVFVSVSGTSLTKNERIFAALSYIPKATVQAALCSIPLSMGLPCGETILTVAVVSIFITAPVGAALIDNLYKSMLS